jgi:hypothetical protein
MSEGILQVPVDIEVCYGGERRISMRVYLVTAPHKGDWIDCGPNTGLCIPVERDVIIGFGSVMVRHYVHSREALEPFERAGFK